MKRLLAVAATILLASCPPVQAKGTIASVALCGTRACGPQVGGPGLRPLTRDLFGALGGAVTLRWAPPPIAPYYHLVPAGEGGSADADLFWVPASATLCGDRGCLPVGPRVQALLRTASAGVRPLAPGVRSVLVDGRAVSDPRAFRDLYDPRPVLPIPGVRVYAGRRIFLELRGPRSPWTIGGRGLAAYYPARRLLELDGRWMRLDATLDHRIQVDAGVAAETGARPAGVIAAGAVVAAGAAAAAGAAVRRRRRVPST